MNFSLLLARSTQFGRFADVLYPSYPDQIERQLLMSMVQMLWDRGEANGYAWHMTRDPYPGTPRHTVLLHEAFGDHQVANVATEVEARVIGARLRTPALDPGRSRDRRPFYRIPRIRRLPVRRQRPGGVRHRAAARRRARHARARRSANIAPTPVTRSGPRAGSITAHRLRARRRDPVLGVPEARTGRSSTPAAADPATRRVGPGP